MPDPRLLIEEELAPGARVRLDGDRARHLTAVLRLSTGARVRVFNARDGEWRAIIAAAEKRGAELAIESRLRAPRAPRDLDLLFAPVKRHATDLIVEKAAELGAARLIPIITQRTIAETVRLDRLALIAREAAEQAERFDAPAVLPPVQLAKALDGWDQSRPLIYADEAGDDESQAWGGESGRAKPIADALENLKTEKLALLIGPEGGFDPNERRLLRALPYVIPVSLGPRILRAETAVIAALAVIQAHWGDWRA
ncbi:MAG: 16S rRNA (uracil(1498)-N(3))-methyltransferase [Hyphomonadaceae bacterium]